MATINLGAIKFNWQGAYAGGTAYAVDDVVSYNGSSYVCILASTGNLPTNATYFEQMSSAGTNGTNGTDLTTTLTTQGDLVYRDGSGLQRLGAGTAGQALITGGAGANPTWGNAGGGKLRAIHQSSDNIEWVSSNSSWNDTGSFITWTPTASDSKYIVMAQSAMWRSSGGGYASWKMVNSGGNTDTIVRNGDITTGATVSFPVMLTSPSLTTGTTSAITTTVWFYPNGVSTYWSNNGGVQDGVVGGKNRWFVFEYEA
jgi:hypothetical protein